MLALIFLDCRSKHPCTNTSSRHTSRKTKLPCHHMQGFRKVFVPLRSKLPCVCFNKRIVSKSACTHKMGRHNGQIRSAPLHNLSCFQVEGGACGRALDAKVLHHAHASLNHIMWIDSSIMAVILVSRPFIKSDVTMNTMNTNL